MKYEQNMYVKAQNWGMFFGGFVEFMDMETGLLI